VSQCIYVANQGDVAEFGCRRHGKDIIYILVSIDFATETALEALGPPSDKIAERL
jgi:hypothetical protein